jgi:hypothetical protein
MKKEQIIRKQEKKVEGSHWEIQQCKSHFQFLDDELLFIARLLDSGVFQPNSPNLFERLQDYKTRIKRIEATKKEVREHISEHENTLGRYVGMCRCACDMTYYRKHDKLQIKFDSCLS